MTAVAAPADRVRLASQRQQVLALSRHRLMLCLLLFLGLTLLIGARLVWLTVLGDRAGTAGLIDGSLPVRADIVDRNGVSLAQTFDAWSIGIHPNKLLGDRREVAEQLARVLPGRSAAEFYALLDPHRSFSYIKRRALPEVAAAVNAIGEPAIALEREPERLYPQTALASHVIGWTNIDGLGVTGMERVLDERLKDPALRGQPVALSIDSRVQAAMESELGAAMVHFQAVGASGLVLDVHTGELLALASLPSFNPNAPGQAPPDARFNRATLGVYELGSTFKPVTLAMGLESGVIKSLAQRYDATKPLEIGKYKIHDDHPQSRWLTVPEVLIYSSNIGTARIADAIGEEREKIMFRRMGFDRPVDIELHEKGRPLWPGYWGRTTTMTVGYGHGIAITPLHLASAYASLVNGGMWHPATLLKRSGDAPVPGRRVVSEATSATIRQLLRLVVLDGTGRRADVPGYRIGGKTGTAEKAEAGGYAHHSLVTTFAGVFPMDNPRYVVIAMLDEPKGTSDTYGLATAAWNAAPVVSHVIARVGPMIGVYPDEHKDIDVSNLTPLLWKAPGTKAAGADPHAEAQ
jgi:cell division protein FtsI (penicillin-binding protein 3)